MIDISHLRRRRSSSARLVYCQSSSTKQSKENLPPKSPTLPQIPFQKCPDDLPSVTTLSNITQNLDSFTRILEKASSLGRNGEVSEVESEIQEIKNKIAETFIGQDSIFGELKEISEEYHRRVMEISENIGRSYESIRILNEKKEKVGEVVKSASLRNGFYRDFSNLEILEISEEPLKMALVSRYDSKYIKFTLTETENSFDYHLEECNFQIPTNFDYFSKDIQFDQSDFRGFYIELMDLIYNTE